MVILAKKSLYDYEVVDKLSCPILNLLLENAKLHGKLANGILPGQRELACWE